LAGWGEANTIVRAAGAYRAKQSTTGSTRGNLLSKSVHDRYTKRTILQLLRRKPHPLRAGMKPAPDPFDGLRVALSVSKGGRVFLRLDRSPAVYGGEDVTFNNFSKKNFYGTAVLFCYTKTTMPMLELSDPVDKVPLIGPSDRATAVCLTNWT